MTQIIDIGSDPGSGSIVIGRILHIHVDEALLLDGDKVDQLGLNAIGRLGGPTYARLNDQFQMERPPSQLQSDRRDG
jgi:flavin reductase (DIM6/NTAB) family NADH-FMN oxidoreductase RutF